MPHLRDEPDVESEADIGLSNLEHDSLSERRCPTTRDHEERRPALRAALDRFNSELYWTNSARAAALERLLLEVYAGVLSPEIAKHAAASIVGYTGKPLVKITLSRLLFSFATVSFGLAKAIAAYGGENANATTLDWLFGIVVVLLFYWLETIASENPDALPWLLQRDYSAATWRAFKALLRVFPLGATLFVVMVAVWEVACKCSVGDEAPGMTTALKWGAGFVVGAVCMWLMDDERIIPRPSSGHSGTVVVFLMKAFGLLAAYGILLSTCGRPFIRIAITVEAQPMGVSDLVRQTVYFVYLFGASTYGYHLTLRLASSSLRHLAGIPHEENTTARRPNASRVVSTLFTAGMTVLQLLILLSSSEYAARLMVGSTSETAQ